MIPANITTITEAERTRDAWPVRVLKAQNPSGIARTRHWAQKLGSATGPATRAARSIGMPLRFMIAWSSAVMGVSPAKPIQVPPMPARRRIVAAAIPPAVSTTTKAMARM